LTVKLAKAMRIPDDLMAEFKSQTEPLLAQLSSITNNTTVAADDEQKQSVVVRSIVALNEEKHSSSPTN